MLKPHLHAEIYIGEISLQGTSPYLLSFYKCNFRNILEKLSLLRYIYILEFSCIWWIANSPKALLVLFKTDNFLHDLRTRHEIKKLGLMSLTRLIE
jgi:hypothetical protein